MIIRTTAVFHRLVLIGTLLLVQPGKSAPCPAAEPSATLPPALEREVDFVDQIQPIFRAKCCSCHGSELQESGLRLDQGQRALAGGDQGAAIVPGDGPRSPLLLRVAGLGEDGRMPPDDEGSPLTSAQVALVRAWIEQGAKWPAAADAEISVSRHWAFQPIFAPDLPPIKHPEQVRNGIDTFILRRLEQEGAAPLSPEADRATLVRRVTLDLVGLPPTPVQLASALQDERIDWYDKLVEALLDSPRYGERWGRHWLDLARYADSDGYEKDSPRPHAWRWRDWVIAALNRDLPFDRFSIEQLAGDLLSGARLPQRVATGFHRNTLINREGGTDPEEDRVKRTVDRTNTLSKIWLGLTVECAQCHSHKYDPITQREYYGLYGFFNSINEIDIGAPLPAQQIAYQQARKKFDQEHAPYEAAIDQYERTRLEPAFQQWQRAAAGQLPVWFTLSPESIRTDQGTTLQLLEDGSLLAGGKNPGREEVYRLRYRPAAMMRLAGIRIEALTDKRLPGRGPGRSPEGNFQISKLRVLQVPAERAQVSQPTAASDNKLSSSKSDEREPGESARPHEIALTKALANFSQENSAVTQAIDTNLGRGWAIAPRTGLSHVATFRFKEPVELDGTAALAVSMRFGSTRSLYHNLGRFRITFIKSSQTETTGPLPLYALTDRLADILARPVSQHTDAQRADLLAYFRHINPELARLRQAAIEHAKQAPRDPARTTKAQVVVERGSPRETHVLVRGDFLQPGTQVRPGSLEVLPALKCRGPRPDRLDLARWLFEPANPLTARVTVNRIWARYFGRGIVATIDNFGTQGERPSHPELLDWLASEFRASHWSLKRLHRLIVTSATYRQSSRVRPKLAARDPYNAWLAYQSRLRVEGEIVRDLALSVSGLIVHRVGGPSVRPPQPEGVAMLGYAGSVKWPVSEGDDRYRRGMYTFFQRTVPYPMLAIFDAPDSNLSCVRRDRSNTPLQSLTLWNDPVFFQCAQALGKRIVREVPATEPAEATVDARIQYVFRLCLARLPAAEDLRIVRHLYRTQRRLTAADPEAACQIGGQSGLPPDEAAELAAWILVGQAMLNLDEFITRG